jgi:hypothetical protein
MTDIRIQPLGEHAYGVTLVEGENITDHKVRVSEDVLDALALPDADESLVVRETVAFLLERRTSVELYEEFDLDTIADAYPDEYIDELRTRLT